MKNKENITEYTLTNVGTAFLLTVVTLVVCGFIENATQGVISFDKRVGWWITFWVCASVISVTKYKR